MPFNREEWEHILEKAGRQFGLVLTGTQLAQFSAHAELLLRWNQKTNLTTITEPEDMAVKHFIDAAAPIGMVKDEDHLIDLGSGGGFPGLPLKILNPSLQVTLVDASRKKVSFLKEVIRTLGLTGIQALHARGEELALDPKHLGKYDVAVSRAFSSLASFVSMALPFVKKGGRIIAMKAKKISEEMESLRGIDIRLQNGMLLHGDNLPVDIHSYELPFSNDKRAMISLMVP